MIDVNGNTIAFRVQVNGEWFMLDPAQYGLSIVATKTQRGYRIDFKKTDDDLSKPVLEGTEL